MSDCDMVGDRGRHTYILQNQGQLGFDQSFDKNLVQFGKSSVLGFGDCIEAENHNGSAKVILKDRNDTAVQKSISLKKSDKSFC